MTEHDLQDAARRLVQNEVCYCVSALINTMSQREWDGSDGVDQDDLIALSFRQPNADDYRDAAREAGVFDTPAKPGTADLRRIDITQGDGVWFYATTDEDGDAADEGQGYDDTEAGGWRAGFDSLGIDHPEGAEVLEHWLISDWLADKLEAKGESVVRDLCGLTVWGRATTGQAIYCDGVIEEITREMLEA
jgi:hypothetical protein